MSAHAGGDNVHTRRIAEFVSGLTYEKIPAEVRERIKLLILDSLGCAIYGANLEWCRILRGTLEQLDATRTTSIWGTGAKLSSDHAALVNGTQVQGFELDDVHRKAVLHVGAVTLPAVIAVAESHAQLVRTRFPHRRCCRLRDRPARRPLHGTGAYRPGLAFRRDGRNFLGGGRRGARIVARCRKNRACARHRRHAIVRADGRAIRRHGKAHARGPRRTKRPLRRPARCERVHRHRRCVRSALRRLLHHVLALDRPLQS